MSSRVEEILKAKSEGTSYDRPAQSRIEEILLGLDFSGSGGGGSVDLTNVKKDITSLKGKTTKVENRVTTLEEDFTSFGQSVNTLKTDIDSKASSETVQALKTSTETALTDTNTKISEIQTTLQEKADSITVFQSIGNINKAMAAKADQGTVTSFINTTDQKIKNIQNNYIEASDGLSEEGE